YHQRVSFSGFVQRRIQSLRIALAVLELQRIDGVDVAADLEAALGIEQRIQPRPRPNAMVMATLGTHPQVLFEIRTVEHRLARRALAPQPFRHGLAGAGFAALDLGRKKLLQPAHRYSLQFYSHRGGS